MTSEIRLGEAANLLHGLDPDWANSVDGTRPFVRSPRAPFHMIDLKVDEDSTADWSEPTLSLHDTVEELIDEIFDYRVLPFPADPGAFRLPASTLILNADDRGTALSRISDRLGIDLTARDCRGFMLLKMTRVVGGIRHELDEGGTSRALRIQNYWTSEGRNAMGRLRVSEKIHDGAARDATVTARQAARYVDYFYDLGTHYVSRIQVGDLLLQVLVCQPARYQALKQQLLREANSTCVRGDLVSALRIFTSSEWIQSYGRIISASGDVALTQSLQDGLWHDPMFAKGDSLLAPLSLQQTSRRMFYRQFACTVPIAIEFSPQHSLMEVFRAAAWQRILKVCLLQRYVTGIQVTLPPKRFPDCSTHFSAAPLFSAIASPTTVVVQERLTSRNLQWMNSSIVQKLMVSGMAVEFDAQTHRLPGQHVIIFAFQAIARSENGRIPTLTLEDEAFETFEFINCEMQGALFVTNRDGTQVETIADGLRLGCERIDGDRSRVRVVVLGDLSTPKSGSLSDLIGALEASLDTAGAMLLSHVWMIEQTRSAGRRYLEWLARILVGQEPFQQMHEQVLDLLQSADLQTTAESNTVGSFSPETLFAPFDIAVAVQPKSAQIRMVLRDCRFRELHSNDNDPVDANRTLQLLREFAGDLRRLGDRTERALKYIRPGIGERAPSDRVQTRGDAIDAIEADLSLAAIELHRQKWRLTYLLLKAWNLLDDTVNSTGKNWIPAFAGMTRSNLLDDTSTSMDTAGPAPIETLDLGSLATTMLARQRQFYARISLTTRP
jgi:hypothetical protein